MEMRRNRVKEKLQNGERAYVAAGNAHASDIDAFGTVSYTHLTLPTIYSV